MNTSIKLNQYLVLQNPKHFAKEKTNNFFQLFQNFTFNIIANLLNTELGLIEQN